MADPTSDGPRRASKSTDRQGLVEAYAAMEAARLRALRSAPDEKRLAAIIRAHTLASDIQCKAAAATIAKEWSDIKGGG